MLQELLNRHFPCNKTSSNSSDTAPKIHQVLNLALSATASDTHLSRIQSWLATQENIIWHSDLLIVESAVNDVEELEWYKVTKAGPVAAIQITTEVLIRQVRATLLNIGILYLGSTWRNFLDKDVKPPYYYDAVDFHLPVTKYYGVDHISMRDAFQPFAAHEYRAWLASEFFNGELHPKRKGHLLIAETILHAFLSDLVSYRRGEFDTAADLLFHSEGFRDMDALPQPLYVQESQLPLLMRTPKIFLDFGQRVGGNYVARDDMMDWTWGLLAHGRYGLHSDAVNATIIVKLNDSTLAAPTDIQTITATFLHSYRGRGSISIEFRVICSLSESPSLSSGSTFGKTKVMDLNWDRQVSVLTVSTVYSKDEDADFSSITTCTGGSTMIPFLVITVLESDPVKKENIVELFSISVY